MIVDKPLIATDEELARQSQAGSLASFEELVRRHEAHVFRFVRQRCGNPDDARDVTQIAFVSAFRHLHQFTARSSFKSWLFTIARNKTIDHLRSRRIHEEVKADHLVETGSPAHTVEHHEQADLLWAMAKRALNGEQFETLWLRYQEDLSISEIARVLHRTETMIKVSLFRARRKLAARLQTQEKENHILRMGVSLSKASSHSVASLESQPQLTL